MKRRRLSRRAVLAGLASIPAAVGVGIVLRRDEGSVATGSSTLGSGDTIPTLESKPNPTVTSNPSPTPTATPEPPFALPKGEAATLLMEGTPYETRLHLFGSGSPGEVLMVLGGVHGNEPGGWLAAERVVEGLRPEAGGLLVVPKANIQATNLFVRTTDEMGDLNRLYPGDENGLPMAQMAYELVGAMRENHVSLVLGLHESWAFYRDREQSGTAFLGQTVTTLPGPGSQIGLEIVEAVNQRIQAPHEELFFRDRSFASRARRWSNGAGSSSSLGIPSFVSGASAILVEMGQQQPLERRIALHVEVVKEGMHLLGMAQSQS